MSGNTSATGGPLLPVSGGPAPLQGEALEDFIQGWIVGITGIAGAQVRPRWQVDVASLPTSTTVWCAFGISSRGQPESPWIQHDPTGNGGLGQDNFARTQELSLLLTWYDVGSGGQADFYDGLMVDGMTIGQNREYLRAQGFDYGSIEHAVTVPMLVKERWQYRLDRTLLLRRVVKRSYPVQTVVQAEVLATTDVGGAESVLVQGAPPSPGIWNAFSWNDGARWQ